MTLAEEGDNAAAINDQAVNLFRTNSRNALELLNRAIELDPNNQKIHTNWSAAYVELKDF